jgi:hypothetical protein
MVPIYPPNGPGGSPLLYATMTRASFPLHGLPNRYSSIRSAQNCISLMRAALERQLGPQRAAEVALACTDIGANLSAVSGPTRRSGAEEGRRSNLAPPSAHGNSLESCLTSRRWPFIQAEIAF